MALWSLVWFWFLCFFCFFIGVLCGGVWCGGYQQVYIVSVIIYYYSSFFIFIFLPLMYGYYVNNLTLLMLFTVVVCVVWGVCIYWFPSKLIFAFFEHCSVCGFWFLCVCLFFYIVFCMNSQFRMFTNEQNIYEICQKLCKIC